MNSVAAALNVPVPIEAVYVMHDRLSKLDDAPRVPHRRYAKVLREETTVIDYDKNMQPITSTAFKPIKHDVVRQLLPEFNRAAWVDHEYKVKSKRARPDIFY